MKKLIVNADDFGLSSGTNRAIIDLYNEGIVTNTTILVNHKAFNEAISLYKKNTGLGLGLHINLLDGHCVANPNKLGSLVNNNGEFLQSPYLLYLRLISGSISKSEVEYELRMQIEKLLSENVAILNLDGHQHIHFFPVIYDVVLSLMNKYGIKRIRFPHDNIIVNEKASPQRTFVCTALKYYSLTRQKKLIQSNILFPKYFCGVRKVGNINKTYLLKFCEKLPDGITELMCHPAYLSDDLRVLKYHWVNNHNFKEETIALMDADVKQKLKKMDIQLINYGNLI